MLEDLVVLGEPNAPPFMWPLGHIIGVSPGCNGVMQCSFVKTLAWTFEGLQLNLKGFL